MVENFQIRIAEVGISIEGDAEKSEWQTPQAYSPFIEPGETDISLRLHRGIPDSLTGKKVFDSPPIWTLYRHDGTSIIKIFDKFAGLERTLVWSNNVEKADLYFPEKPSRFYDPFYGPTMELLMVNYLAQGWGVIIHSCGIAWNEKGILFVGESGAGKSTLAEMWAEENGVEVLSDDRIIVRKKGDIFWMYGTPWHGDAPYSSPRGVSLEGIFFLKHGRKNSVKKLKGAEPILSFLTCSFPPYWDPDGMAFALDLFTDLAAHVPCHELAFRPDKTVIELVKEIAGC